MALPNVIFVREVKDGDGTTFLIAERLVIEAIDGEGRPTVVGTYKLVGKRLLKRNPLPLEVKSKRSR